MHNPENTMFIAKIIGTCIAACIVCFFLIGLFFGDKLGIEPLKFSDKFNIGYIEDLHQDEKKNNNADNENLKRLNEENKLRTQALKHKLMCLKLEEQLKRVEKSIKDLKSQPVEQDKKLLQECISALVAVGEKRSSAKNIAENYLNKNPNTATVEQFISGVFER